MSNPNKSWYPTIYGETKLVNEVRSYNNGAFFVYTGNTYCSKVLRKAMFPISHYKINEEGNRIAIQGRHFVQERWHKENPLKEIRTQQYCTTYGLGDDTFDPDGMIVFIHT